MLTQIIAGDSLLKLGKLVHEMRELWNMEQYCDCPLSKEINQKSNGKKEIIKSILSSELNIVDKEESSNKSALNGILSTEEKTSPLSWLADVALSTEDKKNDDSSDSDESSFSTLRELLIRPSCKTSNSRPNSPVNNTAKTTKKLKIDDLEEVISSAIENSISKSSENSATAKIELKHFIRRYNWQHKSRGQLPIRIMTLTESKQLYTDTPHSWLCDGKLLRLSESNYQGNYKIFQVNFIYIMLKKDYK